MTTTIKGHPEIVTESPTQTLRITVCAECGSLRSVLWLSSDRWYCRSCRAEGAGKSKLIPISNPARRR